MIEIGENVTIIIILAMFLGTVVLVFRNISKDKNDE